VVFLSQNPNHRRQNTSSFIARWHKHPPAPLNYLSEAPDSHKLVSQWQAIAQF